VDKIPFFSVISVAKISAKMTTPPTQRDNEPVFFKIVKNRSISLDFCKKQSTF